MVYKMTMSLAEEPTFVQHMNNLVRFKITAVRSSMPTLPLK